MKIIGRQKEQKELKRYFESGKPEFIAVTGRRCVGKTCETNTRCAIHTTMITTYGLADKGYRAAVQSEVTLNDLFI